MSDTLERFSPRRPGEIFEIGTNLNTKHLADSGLPHAARRAPDASFGAASDHTGPENP